jgi:putative SOS response-associated peptidase YedK
MCGRFALHANPEVVVLQFGLAAEPAIECRYNIAPSLNILIVRQDASGRRLSDYYRWGLIPGWATDPAIGSKCANARGETVAEKPAFRTAFRHWRCLVPASGFYEWKTERGRKQPYYIRPRRSGDLFGLAGITELRNGPKGAVRTVCLITTAPNELMEPIHDRMPVIVPPEQYPEWLDPGNKDIETLKAFISPYDPERMTAYPVSKAVSNARNEGAALVEPLESLAL